MNSLPVEVAAQVPALYAALLFGAVIVTSVFAYLLRKDWADRKEREADRLERKETREFIGTLGESCHSAQAMEGAQNRTMMAECSTALRQNSTALASNAEVLRDVRDILDEQRKGK